LPHVNSQPLVTVISLFLQGRDTLMILHARQILGHGAVDCA